MNSRKSQWITMGLVAAVAVLATLLAVQFFKDPMPSAMAQGEAGSAGYVIGLLGAERSDRLPLFMIDTKAQTILVYEYIFSTRHLYMRVARSFAADRDLEDNSFGRNNIYEGPSVKEVQDLLRRRTGTGTGR